MDIRLAGKALPAIKAALSAVLPKSKGEALLRYGPEILYAGLAAGMAPEGTSGLQRAALAGEDLAIGLGSSIIGQLGGLAAGRRALGRGKALNRLTPDEAQKLQNYINVGDILAGPLNIASPRPIMEGTYRDLALEQEQLQQAQLEAQMQEREQALIQALLGGGSALLR